MPTYEYRCPRGHEFEKFQRMTASPMAECPECGEAAERILSGGAGLLFKGEGFYATDYRSESYRKAAAEEQGQPDGGGESGGSGSSAEGGGPGRATSDGTNAGKGSGE